MICSIAQRERSSCGSTYDQYQGSQAPSDRATHRCLYTSNAASGRAACPDPDGADLARALDTTLMPMLPSTGTGTRKSLASSSAHSTGSSATGCRDRHVADVRNTATGRRKLPTIVHASALGAQGCAAAGQGKEGRGGTSLSAVGQGSEWQDVRRGASGARGRGVGQARRVEKCVCVASLDRDHPSLPACQSPTQDVLALSGSHSAAPRRPSSPFSAPRGRLAHGTGTPSLCVTGTPCTGLGSHASVLSVLPLAVPSRWPGLVGNSASSLCPSTAGSGEDETLTPQPLAG